MNQSSQFDRDPSQNYAKGNALQFLFFQQIIYVSRT